MEGYMVSARKYRPMTFDTVVGQGALTTTLKKSIQTGHLAHAYLFCGPRGVGKTTCARIFAKIINCMSPTPDGEACGVCESCMAFNEQRSLNIYELDAASNNGVDEIKKLIEQTRIPPQVGKFKVFIIDEVHMLSNQAFNAFLKTLEEPPHYVVFILATTEKHKLLPTILSRCQIYDFNRMTVKDTVAHLQQVAEKEGITAEPAALTVIAEKADGGMRDALSIFDQVAAYCDGNITYKQTIANLNVLDYDYYFKLVDYFLSGDIPSLMLTFNEVLSKGFDGSYFIGGLNSHLRNLLISKDASTVSLLETSDEIRHAILAEDVNRIKSVKGIGLKSAQRLVLELKDKIVKGAGTESSTIFKADTNALVDEATTALVMLGFTKANINKVMPSILKENPGARVEEIIKAALKKLSRKEWPLFSFRMFHLVMKKQQFRVFVIFRWNLRMIIS